MITIEELKEVVQDLPPLPDVSLRLLHMCQDPDISPRDIVEVIKLDPALTVQVLRLCNSPFYGLPREVTSLQEAMVYLGTDALVNFVLAGCLSTYYQGETEGFGLDRGELWRNAVGCAICSQRVANQVDEQLAGMAFTGGLLHDVGKIILNTYVSDAFQGILKRVQKEGYTFLEAERKVLGYTHTDAGAEIAAHWNLPAELVHVVRYLHEPLAAPEHQKLVAVVHVGNILCITFGIGVGSDGLAYSFQPGVNELLGLDVKDLYSLSVEIHDTFRNAQELLHLA